MITDGQGTATIKNIDGIYGHGDGWPMKARLRLRNGKFRYEFFSDFGGADEPVTGTYSIERRRMTLHLDRKWRVPQEKYTAVHLEYRPNTQSLKVYGDYESDRSMWQWSGSRSITPHEMFRIEK